MKDINITIVYVCKDDTDISWIFEAITNRVCLKQLKVSKECEKIPHFEIMYYIRYIVSQYKSCILKDEDNLMRYVFLNDCDLQELKVNRDYVKKIVADCCKDNCGFQYICDKKKIIDISEYGILHRFWDWHFTPYVDGKPIPLQDLEKYELPYHSLFIVDSATIQNVTLEAWRHWLVLLEDTSLWVFPQFDQIFKVFLYGWYLLLGGTSQQLH